MDFWKWINDASTLSSVLKKIAGINFNKME